MANTARKSGRAARGAGRPDGPAPFARVLAIAALWTLSCGPGAAQDTPAAAAGLASEPGPAEPDRFHPDRVRDRARPSGEASDRGAFEPERGGRVIVHVATMPGRINYMLDNSADSRRILYELHENLIQPDWETWEYRGVLAERWTVEDALVLRGGRGPDGGNVVYGELAKTTDGWRVTPRSPRPGTGGGESGEPRLVPYDDVERVERGTVFTFHVRPGVRWHDGHVLDGRDVLFSYSCYRNPDVQCGAKRYQFDQITRAELVDPMTVRFFFDRQYFRTLSTFENLTVLPAHRFDLSDPENPDHRPGQAVSDAAQARYVNEHPGNRDWIGLGPYRMTAWTPQYIEAERFDGYFDPARGGWLDTIRWRHVGNPDVALQALLEGELDFLDVLGSEDYFGGRTASPGFQRRYYKGYYYTPRMSYTAWNTRLPKLSDPRVRRALGMCFDWDEFIASFYKGLAFRVTGMQYYQSPGYDKSIEPLPFDLAGAEGLLADAGWYDRDGDGWVDRDGQPFELEYLVLAGNPVSEVFAQRFQENMARVGVRMKIVVRDWASMFSRIEKGEFEAATLGVVLDIESDPEQTWHSRRADVVGSNYSGIADPDVDRWIEQLQAELDPAVRADLYHRIQARIYALQPYMFGVYVPVKFAMSRRVRNFQNFALDPGYSIRRWYVVED